MYRHFSVQVPLESTLMDWRRLKWDCKNRKKQQRKAIRSKRMGNTTLTTFWFQSLTGFKSKWFIIIFFLFPPEWILVFSLRIEEFVALCSLHLFRFGRYNHRRKKSMNFQMNVQSSKWFSWFRLRDLFTLVCYSHRFDPMNLSLHHTRDA